MSASNSSMSASNSSINSNSPHKSKLCECGLRAMVDTSYTVKNPYRRFLRCPKFQGYQCGFFSWIDPWRPPQVDDVNLLNGEAERAKVNMWIDLYSQVTKDKEYQREIIKELRLEVEDLRNVNKKLKKKLLMIYLIIASIVMCVVALGIA